MSSSSFLPLNKLVVALQALSAVAARHAGNGAVRGDTSSRNEKSDILASCLQVGGVLFRPLAIRHDVSPGHRGCDTPGSQKAPSTKRCIKTWIGVHTQRFSRTSESTERQKVH